jgi:SAM-dependent methyltransferase
VTGVDVNEGMLAVARRADPAVEWRAGAAEDLPVPDGAFDRVTAAFALMFLVDRRAALAEVARVVAPGGAVAVATWAAVDRSPGYAALVGLLDRLFGEEAAAALRAPFTIGTEAELAAAVGEVFPDVVVEERAGTARFGSLDRWLWTEIKGWTLADMVDDEAMERLLAEARTELAGFVAADGTVAFPAPALVAIAPT